MHPQNVCPVLVAGRNSGSGSRAAEAVILVVTPDANLRAASARSLQREGYRVLTAAHAGHAVLACRTVGRVDVLVTELSMEDVSGPALADRLRRQCEIRGTVYLAGAGTPECDGVLVRPFTRDDLLAALATTAAAADAWVPTSSAS